MCPAPTDLVPLNALLHGYADRLPSPQELETLPHLGERFAAIRSASVLLTTTHFLDDASETDWQNWLLSFHASTSPRPLHAPTVRRRAGIIRHAFAYLLRGDDPAPKKMENCLDPGGTYHVSGLGPAFWSACVQSTNWKRLPGWLPETWSALNRLGVARGTTTADRYASLVEVCEMILGNYPRFSAQNVDHFLILVDRMTARELCHPADAPHGDFIGDAVSRLRSAISLREHLKHRGEALTRAQHKLAEGLHAGNPGMLSAALAEADPTGWERADVAWSEHGETLLSWARQLWEGSPATLSRRLQSFWQSDPLPGAGLWLPAALLHLRDPLQYRIWNEPVRKGYALIDDAVAFVNDPAESYRLFNEGMDWLCQCYSLHPLLTTNLLVALGEDTTRCERSGFRGFCRDTFHFLAELEANNNLAWMNDNRARYRFAVRSPLVELCERLTAEYVEPVLKGVHQLPVATGARNGQALTSICKNAYGNSELYNTAVWITFCPPASRAGDRERQPQFFIRLDPTGLRFGLRLGPRAKDARKRLACNLRDQHDSIRESLEASGGLTEVGEWSNLLPWVESKREIEIARALPADSPLLVDDALVGEVVLMFDRLVPLYISSLEDNPQPRLEYWTGKGCCSESSFLGETYLDEKWLERARELLGMKRQLILQGVPGTGKTHVARCLGKLLTGGREEAIRLIQFHPAYSYEEFVEGIKVRSIEVEGKREINYPVEDGLLTSFAAQAALHPSQPHVLIIDEMNRGNLPRIFGELLFLLEYREQEVELPYSHGKFRLPANLYLIGTMNALDRSTTPIDNALRRRFSILEMPPDARVLSRWLSEHPPRNPEFAHQVLELFERLNARLRDDIGPDAMVGHSYFMVPNLDEGKLNAIWKHHVVPLLAELFVTQPGRLSGYELGGFLKGESTRRRERKPVRA